MRIAVAGGTGLIGRKVVTLAEQQGHEVVVLARSVGVDLVAGTGVTEKLLDVKAVIDVSNTSRASEKRSTSFFAAASRNLLAAEREAGVGHHVALSVVGVDRAAVGYYAGKQAQERVVEASPVAWTILRATQFHEFAAQVYGLLRLGPLHLAPTMRTQPIAAAEVAERLVALVVGPPTGMIIELAGPREESLVAMIRGYARTRGSRAWIPSFPLPGAYGRALRDGSLLPRPGAELGRQTYAEWLEKS